MLFIKLLVSVWLIDKAILNDVIVEIQSAFISVLGKKLLTILPLESIYQENSISQAICSSTKSRLQLSQIEVFVEILQRKLPLLRFFSNGFTSPILQTMCIEQDSNGNEALHYFLRINESTTKPTKFIICKCLNLCAKSMNLYLGVQIHARVIRVGHEENLFLNSALVDLYSKCDEMDDARRLFRNMKRHDQVSWTSIIHGFVHNGHGKEAILLFKDMLETQIKPNCFTYVSVVSACSKMEDPHEQCSLIHALVLQLGFEGNNFLITSMIDCYSKCGCVDEARLLFEFVKEKDTIVINAMITGFSQNMYCEEALRLFTDMRIEYLTPTDHTLTSVLNSCGSLTMLRCGRQVHSLVIKMGSESNVFIGSVLLDMYSKCGSIDEACRVFDQTVEKNHVMWTSMIMAYAQSGEPLNGVKIFDHLVSKLGFVPDHVCFTAILTACNHAGLIEKGIRCFNDMMKIYGLVPKLDHYSCLIDLHAKNGLLKRAKELMKSMPFDPNPVMLSSFLSSCRDYGEVELGREAAEDLLLLEPCKAAHYVTIANLYARDRSWDKVAEIRRLMKENVTKKRSGWSWIEVDRTVHVFSVDDTSHLKVDEIYLELKKLTSEICKVLDIGENVMFA